MNVSDGPSPSEVESNDDEYFDYLYLLNLPFSVPGQSIALFFQHHIGPVQFFDMHVDQSGQYMGKASVLFVNLGDATKTLLLARHGLSIQG